MENAPTPQGVWEWDRGVYHITVRYVANSSAANAADASGELTWIEEMSPEDDERGNGSHTESTQTLTQFLRKGPHSSPPVVIVEALLDHFQAHKPSWFDPYRILVAAKEQDCTAVREMLVGGVPADIPVNGTTPFYYAVRQQSYEMAEMLFVAGVDVNRHFPGSEETILMTLASFSSEPYWESLAARIVARGADLNARQVWGETALLITAGAGKRLPGLVPLLLHAGADVNARSIHGYTPLMNAVSYRDAPVATVQQLLAAGADVNACDKEGWSALMRAISHSLVPCVRCLLASGADVYAVTTPTQKYREPKSVMQLAEDYANVEIIALIRQAIK